MWSKMGFIQIKEINLSFCKRGRISKHKTSAKGKNYVKGKIYLKSKDDVSKAYELYEIEKMHLINKSNNRRKGKAYLLFLPF